MHGDRRSSWNWQWLIGRAVVGKFRHWIWIESFRNILGRRILRKDENGQGEKERGSLKATNNTAPNPHAGWVSLRAISRFSVNFSRFKRHSPL